MSLWRRYQEEAQPYLDELVKIESSKPAPPIFIEVLFGDVSEEIKKKISSNFKIPGEVMGSEP